MTELTLEQQLAVEKLRAQKLRAACSAMLNTQGDPSRYIEAQSMAREAIGWDGRLATREAAIGDGVERLCADDLRYLSRAFNDADDLRTERGRRVNEHLKVSIARAVLRESEA